MWDRLRSAWSTVSSAPWRRAPMLLRRRPGVLLTVAGACAVMTASTAAVPLFLSSVGTASVELQVDERCPRDTGATLAISPNPRDERVRPPDPFAAVDDWVGRSYRWTYLEDVRLDIPGATDPTTVSVLSRDGAHDEVESLGDSGDPGLWISDRGSEITGLGVGDTATIEGVSVPITGRYRDVSTTEPDDYWCATSRAVLIEVRAGDLIAPPPLFLADPETMATLMEGYFFDRRASSAWVAELAPDLTVADAERLRDSLACRRPDRSPGWCEDGQPLLPDRAGPVERPGFPAEDDRTFLEVYLRSHLPFVVERAHATRTAVGGGTWSIAGFASLAGVGLVAAAASLWVDRRRREVELLTTRGVSPAGIGLKSVLELSPALVVGVAAGTVASAAAVRWLGPSDSLETEAVRQAALIGLAALAAAALTIGTVVSWRARGTRGHRRPWLSAVPWEAVLVWLTVVSYGRLGEWGIPVGAGAEVTHVDLLGLLFPVLFIVTVVAVLSRALALALRPLRALSARWSTSLYLAVRRVARYRVAVLGLAAASAVAAGVVGYATTLNRSLSATLEAKAQTFVGSDVAAHLARGEPVPEALEDRSTEVRIHNFALLEGSRREVAVIGIDPATFDRAAFWDDTFADEGLGSVLERLAAPPADGTVPAVLVGMRSTAVQEVRMSQGRTVRFRIEPIHGVAAFSGMRRPKPTIFVSSAVLEELGPQGGLREVWFDGDRDEIVGTLRATGTAFYQDRRIDEVADRSSFLTVSWTFGFMQTIGVSAGLLVLGGVAVYLDARRRDRLLGYAFMQRMGLTARQHRRALLAELAASVVVGCWSGFGIAAVAAWFAHGRIDPVPSYRPDPLLRPAIALALTLAGLAVVVAGLAAALGQRRIDRDDPVEVLRAGT